MPSAPSLPVSFPSFIPMRKSTPRPANLPLRWSKRRRWDSADQGMCVGERGCGKSGTGGGDGRSQPGPVRSRRLYRRVPAPFLKSASRAMQSELEDHRLKPLRPATRRMTHSEGWRPAGLVENSVAAVLLIRRVNLVLEPGLGERLHVVALVSGRRARQPYGLGKESGATWVMQQLQPETSAHCEFG